MAWNGNGVFVPPSGPEFPAISNDVIRAAYYNEVITQICAAFANTVPRDGQAPMTGNLDFASTFKIKNLPAATLPGEAVRFQEFDAALTQTGIFVNDEQLAQCYAIALAI